MGDVNGFTSLAELERLRVRLERALERADDAAARAEEAEREADEAERRAEEAERHLEEKLQPRASTGRFVRASAEPRVGFDLNQATFEQLRVLGLSVTQSARVIAQREQRGGFTPDDLDVLAGLPREVIATLKESVTV